MIHPTSRGKEFPEATGSQAARPYNSHMCGGGSTGEIPLTETSAALVPGGAAATVTSVSGGNCQGGGKGSSEGSSHWGKVDQRTPALPRASPPPPTPGPSSLPSPSAPPGRRTCSRPAAPAAAPAAPAPPRPAPPRPSCATGHADRDGGRQQPLAPLADSARAPPKEAPLPLARKGRPANEKSREAARSAVRRGRKEQWGRGRRVRSGACTSPGAWRAPAGGGSREGRSQRSRHFAPPGGAVGAFPSPGVFC